jgi:hypothetical protein
MWSLGMEGGVARRNWTTPVAPLAGEGVGKVEGHTNRRFVAADGWGSARGRPAGGTQGAWPRRTWLRCSPGLGRARVAWGDRGDRVELRGRHWTAATRARGGGPRERTHGQAAGMQRPCAGQPVRGLYRRARQRDAPP